MRVDGREEKENWSPTVESMLRKTFPEHSNFHLVHQLDYVTSGVHVWALDRHAARRVCSQFKQRTVEKTYDAIVQGHTEHDEFTVDKDLADMVGDKHKRVCIATPDNPGKSAKTHFKTILRGHFLSHPVTLLSIRPITGRRHQIRVHLRSIGHPIVGDYLYQEPLMKESPRTMLHARRIYLPLPGKDGYIHVDAGDCFSRFLEGKVEEGGERKRRQEEQRGDGNGGFENQAEAKVEEKIIVDGSALEESQSDNREQTTEENQNDEEKKKRMKTS
ncbi:hypothetical protein HDU97_002392 [Phlyctochytrium planicorne]|nr:hypothetical protein HDU97_002392 [Phlyctochytrium planicorne]